MEALTSAFHYAIACRACYANSKTLIFPIEFAEIMVLFLRLQQTLDTN